jgi:uncharacterized protein
MRFKCLSGYCLAALLSVAAFGAQTRGSQLPDAAMKGDLKAVRLLLDQKVDLNVSQADGMTALHWAVRRDDVEMANLLILAGADVEAANRTGATPMYLACTNGNAAIIEKLLSAGADANAPITAEKETPVMLAAFTGNVNAVRVILDHGADIDAKQARGQTALMWAASESHADVVKLLVDRGADVKATSLATNPGKKMTALLFSARQGDLSSAKILVEAGANVDDAMADGTTAMLLAILNGHHLLATYLLDKGANPNLTDGSGRPPLFAAIEMRNPQWAEVPWPDADMDDLELIKILLAKGADPNLKLRRKAAHRAFLDARWSDLIGGTAFLRATQTGDITVMRLLLGYGADPNVITTTKESALSLVAGVGWPLGQGYMRSETEIRESLELCLALGMDVNLANVDGITPLMGAAHKGDNLAIQFLVNNGAKLDAKDSEGRTALVWAEGVFGKSGLGIQPPRRQPQSIALLQRLMSVSSAANSEVRD